MKFHAYIFDFGHNFFNEFMMLTFFCIFSRGQIDPYYHLLKDVVIEIMFVGCLLPFFKHLLELEVQSEGFGIYLMESWQEIFTEVLIIFV